MGLLSRNQHGGRHGSALLYFAAAFVLINVALSSCFDVWRGRRASIARNPHFRRGWVEHVRAAEPKRPDEKLIVVISNSQGYGREVEDKDTYCRLLAKGLSSRTGVPVRVLNWSIPGGKAPAFVLLGAAVDRLNPDVLLLVAGPENFATRWSQRSNQPGKRRKAWASDCHGLLGFSDVRRRTPSAFIAQFCPHPIDWLDVGLSRCWRSWRYRHLPASWVGKASRPLRPFAGDSLERRWFPGRSWASAKTPADPPLASNRPQLQALAPFVADPGLIDQFIEATSSLSARRVYVAMPLHSGRRNRCPEQCEKIEQTFIRNGADLWDASAAISDEHFLTTTHLNMEGHKLMADLLLDHLAP